MRHPPNPSYLIIQHHELPNPPHTMTYAPSSSMWRVMER